MLKTSIRKRPHYGLWCVGLILMSLTLYGCGPMYATDVQASGEIGVAGSYGFLNEWGDWVDYGRFGDVWCPYVEAGWAPFTYGNWLWTDDGWLWSSYEPFGWLVYHYGDWYYDSDIGWFWVPGNTWSPARVIWSEYDNYVCWAPRPPSGLRWPSPWEAHERNPWNVVDRSNFMRENVGDHRVTIGPRQDIGNVHVRHRAPVVKNIARADNRAIHEITVRRDKARIENRTFYKTHWPDEQRQTVEKYEGRYRRGQARQYGIKSEHEHEHEQDRGSRGNRGGEHEHEHGDKH